MNVRLALLPALGLLCPVFAAPTVQLNERIAVSATAAPDYRPGDAPGVRRDETYVFAEGKYFESETKDRGLERTSFALLTKQLAPDLAKQRYFPTTDATAADLLIVVYWGATQVYEDPQRDQMLQQLADVLPAYTASIRETGMADPGEMNRISDSLSWARDNAAAATARNAALLGYARSLHRFGQDNGYLSEREKFLRVELAEERYFVVLMAYDNRAFRQDKVRKLRWVTRLSVRTAGNNFLEALPVLSQAGSHVFGRQTEDLVHLKANLREGRVDIGELRVVATEPARRE